MIRDKKKQRSKSVKRKRTVSADRTTNETQLLKMLDERAQKKKTILITTDELNELKQCKLMLKSLQEEYDIEQKGWKSDLNSLKTAKSALVKENQELKQRIREIEVKDFSYFQHPSSDQQLSLTQVKDSLYSLEALVQHRSQESAKLLKIIHSLLAKHAKILLEQQLAPTNKTKLTSGIKKISQTVSAIENLLTDKPDSVQHNNNTAGIYKQALEKMKSQTILLKERLTELENADGLKKIIEDQDSQILMLTKEKHMLKNHIENLENSLKDQFAFIEGLKRRLGQKKVQTVKSVRHSPEMYSEFSHNIGKNESDLQAEIFNLDSEIQQLQSSLKRALLND
jgi:hypothetical protein